MVNLANGAKFALLPLVALIIVAFTIVACGKKVEEKPKTAEQLQSEKQSEKAATDKVVRDNPVYGDQIKALDKAKEIQKITEAQAAEANKKIDEATK